ncbi:hypothetical protein [Enterococcus mundtii]|uniref:Uncharacterized protein n=1 Tax=Enterococcus mundtii TaxID=53346 RepID=A0A1V2UFR2_ENTMU|nr:hypothetical protein [Enterococcus mundtii]ONN42075.1 hypothetical protein BTN92_11170 [Enterococcus mundtii]
MDIYPKIFKCVYCDDGIIEDYEMSNAFELIDTTCSNGHKFKIATKRPRYAFFFDDAIAQYIKSNYRVSLISLYTALELFWNDFSAAYILHTTNSNVKDLIHTYSSGSLKLSERKYGAFVNSFSLFYKKIYAEPTDDIIGKKLDKKIDDLRVLRNKVMHNGYLLNHKEKIKLKDQIFDVYIYIKSIEDTFEVQTSIDPTDSKTSLIYLYYDKISRYLFSQESKNTEHNPINDDGYYTSLSMFNSKIDTKKNVDDLFLDIKKRI